jgi:hypothetical protein
VESGRATSASIVGSARGGRARSVKLFSSTVTPSAIAAAAVAARAAVGSKRRLAPSQQAPVAAISGHLTHQADASTNTAVSGPQ